ncbi:MAG TPA: hypothetical protein PLP30_01360 [Clostridia bacterium]|nr:hypothetical protein [Clostridia bacterium]HRX41570.1 hypothetical protein [Clostridia bacterium]
MKKIILAALIIALFMTTSCAFIKDRFLDGEPLYGGGHIKGTEYSPSPTPTDNPVD